MRLHNRTGKEGAPKGFTLVEVLVAATIFAIVALVVYAVWDASRWSFKRGSEASDRQQETRVAFDQLVSEVRLAGFNFKPAGDTLALNPADEQIEFVHRRAIIFRADLDYEDCQGGREYADFDEASGVCDGSPGPPGVTLQVSDYETSADWISEDQANNRGFPIVSTANDEIILYALAKPPGSGQTFADVNSGSVTFKADLKGDGDGALRRDARANDLGTSNDNEETITINGVDLTHNDPPYTLYRITFDRDTAYEGSYDVGDLVVTPLADGIRELNFTYDNDRGDCRKDVAGVTQNCYCASIQLDGSCSSSDQVVYTDTLGLDDVGGEDLLGRIARNAIRKIHVEVVGMTESPDFRWTDPLADPADAGDMKAAHHRKFRIVADITSPNLGKVGQLDLDSFPPTVVQEVSICSGQCNFVYVQWKENAIEEAIIGYVIEIYESGSDLKLASKFVGGQEVYSRDPDLTGYLFGTVTEADDEDIENGKDVYARVFAKNLNGQSGPRSDASNVTEIFDVTRPEAVSEMAATGYDPSQYIPTNRNPANPDDPDNIWTPRPVSSTTSDYYPLSNQIELAWDPPAYVLNESSSCRDADAPWSSRKGSTKTDPTAGTEALCCYYQPDGNDKERTPLAELNGKAEASERLTNLDWRVPDDETQGRYLVFRSTEPYFAPNEENLIAVVDGAEYVDKTVHHFREVGGVEYYQYTEAFPVENCTTYFYRVRPADDCWDGTDPSGDDPANGDFRGENLGPFYPPLDPNASNDSDVASVTNGQVEGAAIMGYAIPSGKPEAPESLQAAFYDGGAGGSHRFFLSFDLPKRDMTADRNHIAVSSLRVFSKDLLTGFLIPAGSCDLTTDGGYGDGDEHCSGGLGSIWYYGTITLSTDATGKFPVAGMTPATAGITQLTVAFDDENQSGHVSETGGDGRWISLAQAPDAVTPPGDPHAPGQTASGLDLGVKLEPGSDMEDETSKGGVVDDSDNDYWKPSVTDLRYKKHSSDNNEWYFKLVAVQCKSALHGDDGENSPYTIVSGTPDTDQGVASDWVAVPCMFGEAQQATRLAAEPPDPVDPTPDAEVAMSCPSPFPDQGVTVTVVDGDLGDEDGDNVRACRARLVLQNVHTGDRVASDWQCYDTEDTGSPCAACGWEPDECCDLNSTDWTDEMNAGATIAPGTQFTFTSDQVEDLLQKLRGRDVIVMAEVRESAAGPIILPCSGYGACEGRQTANDCIQLYFEDPSPRIPSDDFTGATDPLTGNPTGLPDGTQDCYQAVEWTFEEGCINGDLDVKRFRIEMTDSGGSPATSPKLLRVYWDYDADLGSGVEIYRSDTACGAEWPGAGCEQPSAGYWEILDCLVTGGPDCNDFNGCDEDANSGCMYFREGETVKIRMEFDGSAKDRQFAIDFLEYDRIDPETGLRTAVPDGTQFLAQPGVLPMPDSCNPCDQDNDTYCCAAANETDGCPTPPAGGCSGTCTGSDWNDLDPDCTNSCVDADGDGANSSACTSPSNSCTPIDCNDHDACMAPASVLGDEYCFGSCDGKGLCGDGKDNDCDTLIDSADRNGTFQGCTFC